MTIDRERHLPRQLAAQADAAAGGLLGAADDGRRACPRRSTPAARSAPLSSRMSGRASTTAATFAWCSVERVVAAPNTVMPDRAQERDDVVLGRAVVAGGDDLGAACGEHLEQHGGLRLDVQRHADAAARERLAVGEISRARRRAAASAIGSSACAHHAFLHEIGHAGSFHIRVLLSYMVTLSCSGAAPVRRMLASTQRVKRSGGPWSADHGPRPPLGGADTTSRSTP